MLSDEFNRLPIEERLKLIGKLVQRMKGLSPDDSVLLAAFASGIGGAARHQLEENASRLAIDLWDKYAKDYGAVPPDKRDEYLEGTYVEFTKMMEDVAGQHRDISDADRVNEGKAQAQRDMKWAKEHPDKLPDGETMGRLFGVMNGNVGSHASPEQRTRGQAPHARHGPRLPRPGPERQASRRARDNSYRFSVRHVSSSRPSTTRTFSRRTLRPSSSFTTESLAAAAPRAPPSPPPPATASPNPAAAG